MSMVSGDKPNFCSCSRTSGILVALGFCEVSMIRIPEASSSGFAKEMLTLNGGKA